MIDLLRTVAAYLPQSLTRSVLHEASPKPPTDPQTRRMEAAVLFADISGFTPLTEALSQKGSEGPEELTRLLNRYFSWMIEFVEAEGGEVVKFGGDSLTVVFSAAEEPLSLATRRALQAARAMQTAMDDFGIMESSVGLVALKMKFGIGAGGLLTSYVGGLYDRWEYIIAGDALRQATQAENEAGQSEIVLSPQAQAIITPQTLKPRSLPALNWTEVKNPAAAEKVLTCYVPGAVRNWLDKGLHSWLATLRPMSVLFIGIKGLDYEQPDTPLKLHDFLRQIQEVIYHYWGSLTRLTIDDKGTVLLVLFGAPPFSHEDDPERALRCALDLQALTKNNDLQLAIGVTADRVFAGPVGGNTRREYTVMGDAVNLAARLMVAAGPGNISCSYQVFRRTAERINFEPLLPMEVKGKIGLIPIYRPVDNQNPTQLTLQRWQEEQEPLIGREAELETLKAALEKVEAGDSQIVIIEGEAGIGKSRLVESLVNIAHHQDRPVLLTIGQSIERQTPFYAWKDFFLAYFDLDPLIDITQSQRHIQAQVRAINPDLITYIPLLNDLLDTGLPENDFTTPLDKAARREYLSTLLAELLQSLITSEPSVFIVENGHWLDPLSWRLVVHMAVTAVQANLALLLVLVTRPLENVAMRTEITMLAALEETKYLRLESLSATETLTLAVQRMGLTHHDLPEAISEFVNRQAGGNPFFAEELFYSLHDNGYISFKTMQKKVRCLINGDLDRARQNLPVTIYSIILARIDQLPPEKQLLLRIAAVIGHTFAYDILFDTLKQNLDIQEGLFKDYLKDLTYLGLIRSETSEPNPTFSFRQVIVREATYESLLFDRRRQLHRAVAQWYEKNYGSEASTELPLAPVESSLSSSPSPATRLASYYPVLVYHWHQAGEEERERIYATLIAQQAVAQFANAEAVSYLNRALELTPRADLAQRYLLLMLRETVYDRQGMREAQAQDLSTLAAIVNQLDNSQHKTLLFLRQAGYAEAIGDYATAVLAAQQAIALAERNRDFVNQSQGYTLWGNVLLQQSNYKTAQEKLERALSLAQNSQHALAQACSLFHLARLYTSQGFYRAAQEQCQQILSLCRHQYSLKAQTYNLLGLIDYYLGDYAAARDNFEQANSIFHVTGERRGSYRTLHNIGLIQLKQGNYEAARDYFEYTAELQREINDTEGIANSLKNLGVVYCKLGDYRAARSYLGQALELYEGIGHRAGEADVLSKFGFVYHQLGDFQTTQRYINMALAIQQSIGHLEGQSYSLTYLGHALAGLEQWQDAEQKYHQVLKLRQQLEQTKPVIDVVAGLAHVATIQGNLEQARENVDDVLTWLDIHQPTALDNALSVYLTCYKVLQNMPDASEQAKNLLITAYNLLQHQANSFNNPKLQQAFLENIKLHQEIMALWTNNENHEA